MRALFRFDLPLARDLVSKYLPDTYVLSYKTLCREYTTVEAFKYLY